MLIISFVYSINGLVQSSTPPEKHGKMVDGISATMSFFSPISSIKSHKRHAEFPEILGLPPSKRGGFGYGPQQGTDVTFPAGNADCDDGNTDEFAGAEEELMNYKAHRSQIQRGRCADSAGEDGHQKPSQEQREDGNSAVDLTLEDSSDEDGSGHDNTSQLDVEPDVDAELVDNMFNRFFRRSTSQQPNENDNEDEETIEDRRQRTQSHIFNFQDSDTEIRGASTPSPELKTIMNTGKRPVTTTRNYRLEPKLQEPRYPHIINSRSFHLAKHQTLHNRALQLIPHISPPLPEHRYWIAIIEKGRADHNVREEKHFMWMRGNRFTTIRTIWHYYQQASMCAEDFALVLAGRVQGEALMCQEIDLFADKLVVLRVVDMGKMEKARTEGRIVRFDHGLDVEVVEID